MKTIDDILVKELAKAPKVIQLAIEVDGDTFIETDDASKGFIIAVNRDSGTKLRVLCPKSFEMEMAVRLLEGLDRKRQDQVLSHIIVKRMEAAAHELSAKSGPCH